MTLQNGYAINGANPVTVGGTGTAAKYFPAPSGQIGVSGVTPSATSAQGQLPIFGNNRANGQPVRIAAAGNFEVGAGGACPNVLIELVANTGTILAPVYKVLGSTGQLTVQNLTGTLYPWSIVLDGNGDSGSGIFQGRYTAVVDGVAENSTPKATDNLLTGINFASEPPFGLVVRVTFSVSEAGNQANMYAFYYEA